MASNNDLRYFIAKKFPLTPLGTISLYFSIMIDQYETNKHTGRIPITQLDDTLVIDANGKLSFEKGRVTFSEKNLYQFAEELLVMTAIERKRDVTFNTMFIQDTDITDLLTPAELGAFNGEIFSTLMKRWHNRHRDGAGNPSVIRRRLKQLDAYIEVRLTSFVYYDSSMTFIFEHNGKREGNTFVIPMYPKVDKGRTSGLMNCLPKVSKDSDNKYDLWRMLINSISSKTGIAPPFVNAALTSLVVEAVTINATLSTRTMIVAYGETATYYGGITKEQGKMFLEIFVDWGVFEGIDTRVIKFPKTDLNELLISKQTEHASPDAIGVEYQYNSPNSRRNLLHAVKHNETLFINALPHCYDRIGFISVGPNDEGLTAMGSTIRHGKQECWEFVVRYKDETRIVVNPVSYLDVIMMKHAYYEEREKERNILALLPTMPEEEKLGFWTKMKRWFKE